MKVLNLSEENFEKEVTKYEGTVLVDFYADWCGPCKMMSPIIDEISNEVEAKVFKVNVDENMNLAEKFEIMSIPTIIVFKNGEVFKVFNGVTDKSVIKEALK